MCILRADGKEFDPDNFLKTSALEPYKIYRSGEARYPKAKPDGPFHEISGINIDVSEASWSELAGQVADAELFLESYFEEIKRLASWPGVAGLTLDFPLNQRIGVNKIAVQCDHFPASLVRLAGLLGLALMLTIYPCSDDDPES